MQADARSDGSWATPLAARAVRASVPLPGSKSITNRALILAALAAGPTRIRGPLAARDTDLMAGAITALGAAVLDEGTDQDDQEADGRGCWLVTPGWTTGPARVNVGNAGTVLRFVPPVAALARASVEFY